VSPRKVQCAPVSRVFAPPVRGEISACPHGYWLESVSAEGGGGVRGQLKPLLCRRVELHPRRARCDEAAVMRRQVETTHKRGHVTEAPRLMFNASSGAAVITTWVLHKGSRFMFSRAQARLLRPRSCVLLSSVMLCQRTRAARASRTTLMTSWFH
jgi:hypothetical protein